MAISSIDPRTCIGCGTCVDTCPTDVIRLSETTKQAIIAYPEECQICNMCAISCPVDAITVTDDKYMKILTAWG